MPPARERFLAVLRSAVLSGSLRKLTLGKYRGPDSTLRNLFVRPVTLRAGARLSFVWRHQTRDVTKNHPPEEALALLEPLTGGDFLDAHLFAADRTLQLECRPDASARLRTIAAKPAAEPKPSDHQPTVAHRPIGGGQAIGGGRPPGDRSSRHNPADQSSPHDLPKSHLIPPDAPWLRALDVTNDAGRPREGMAPKFRQIQKFAELLSRLVPEAGLGDRPFLVADMGCGKGYLTFAISALLGDRAKVRGIELRPDLVELCNRLARDQGWSDRLEFSADSIADAPLDGIDVLIALHACDTATDDALARGIEAGASLLLVAPCCQKELRPQLTAPPVLADALRHGIFQERAAEFVTDALRAQLLEWAGYRTQVFEFISTEHTAKNLMIAAVKSGPARDPALAARLRAFAAFYGIRTQRLAAHLGFDLPG